MDYTITEKSECLPLSKKKKRKKIKGGRWRIRAADRKHGVRNGTQDPSKSDFHQAKSSMQYQRGLSGGLRDTTWPIKYHNVQKQE